MYNPVVGRWLSPDPLGRTDNSPEVVYSHKQVAERQRAVSQPYTYVENNPTNFVDPSGLERIPLPSDSRGTWIKGTKGNGTFQFSDMAFNRARGVAGQRIRFVDNHIAEGGLPRKFYYRRSAKIATVRIRKVVDGGYFDFKAADEQMRLKLRKPKWKRPSKYSWNHAGKPGSTTMELVEGELHSRVHHQGNAKRVRVKKRLARAKLGGGGGGLPGGVSRCVAGLQVYMTVREALQAAGIAQPDFQTIDAVWTFVDDAGDVFVVQEPAAWRFWASPKIKWISGPNAGSSEVITSEELAGYRTFGEKRYGKYIPGGLFREPKFKPGSELKTIPIIDFMRGLETGYVDEHGTHYYKRPRPGGA